MKQNIQVNFGVVEAAGSNPVTQTNANSVVMRKASYLRGWLAFCYLHEPVDSLPCLQTMLFIMSAHRGAFVVLCVNRTIVRGVRRCECPCHVFCHQALTTVRDVQIYVAGSFYIRVTKP